MHTIELLEQAIATATASGCVVRQEWLGGAAAGACEIKGRRHVFIDLSLSPREQLDQVLEALASWPAALQFCQSPQLQALVECRRAA